MMLDDLKWMNQVIESVENGLVRRAMLEEVVIEDVMIVSPVTAKESFSFVVTFKRVGDGK